MTEPAHPPAAPRLAVAQDTSGVFRLCALDECPGPTPKTIAQATKRVIEITPPAPPQPKPATRDVGITIHFELASARLTRQARAAIERARQEILIAERIVIRASTDAVGTKRFNRRLAHARARTVRAHLVSMRVPPEIIHIETACCIENPPRVNPPARRAEITIHIQNN